MGREGLRILRVACVYHLYGCVCTWSIPEEAGVWKISVLGLLSRYGSVALVELNKN